jgi:hypothetical protein
MSRPRFLADEDLNGDIVRAVRRMAPAVEFTTAVQQGLRSAPDEDILEVAWQTRWLVVSHDVGTLRHAAELRIATGQGVHGVFLASQSRTVREIADELVFIEEASEFEDWRNQVKFLPL